MIEQPSLGHRDAQRYVAIATAITMDEFDVVESLTGEVFAWLERKGAAPSGPAFTRIVTSDMSAKLDIEVGVAVDASLTGDDRFIVGAIPPGSYVTVFYSAENQEEHIQANVVLQAWAANEGLEWQMDRSGDVEKWGGRFEFFRADKSSDGRQVFELTYQVTENIDPTSH